MTMDGQIKWKTDRQPAFVRGGSILADGLLLTSDGNTKLYLVEPDPSGFKPLASAVVLEPGDNWAPLALVDGKLLIRGQKQLKPCRSRNRTPGTTALTRRELSLILRTRLVLPWRRPACRRHVACGPGARGSRGSPGCQSTSPMRASDSRPSVRSSDPTAPDRSASTRGPCLSSS